MKSEMEEKYQHYVRTLTERIQTCDTILNQVDETLELFNDLQLQHQAVATKTKTLHDACDRLVMEKQSLIEFAESLCAKLNYFDELENIYRGKRRMCRNRSKRQLNGMIWVLLRWYGPCQSASKILTF